MKTGKRPIKVTLYITAEVSDEQGGVTGYPTDEQIEQAVKELADTDGVCGNRGELYIKWMGVDRKEWADNPAEQGVPVIQ